jgi:hypothetical protein
VAGDQVAAQARGRQQRALEVHRRAAAQRRAWSAPAFRWRHRPRKPRVEGDHGEAHADHRDAFAQLQSASRARRWRCAGAGRRRALRSPRACPPPAPGR